MDAVKPPVRPEGDLATSTVVAEAFAQELTGASMVATGLPQLDAVLALRAVWIFTIAAWISRKCDPFLMVFVISMLGTAASKPIMELHQVHELAKLLPGIGVHLDASQLFVSFQSSETALKIAGVSSVATACLLGWLVSKKSPVLALVVYILTCICNAQSGLVDDYPARILAPLFVLALSAFSKHVRYLNVAAAVFAASFMNVIQEGEQALFRDLLPLALWGGFMLLIVHDILVRAGVIEGVSFVATAGVILFTLTFVIYSLSKYLDGVDLSFMAPWMEHTLTWEELAQLNCLPACMGQFEASLPGVFCTTFGIVTILRNIIGGRSNFIKGITSTGIVITLAAGSFIAAQRGDLLLCPNVTAVIALLALFISERASGVPGAKGHSSVRKQIGYHIVKYWITPAAAAALEEEEMGASDNKADEAEGTVTGRHVTFVDGPADSRDKKLPSSKEMEKIWQNVNRIFDEVEKAKKVHAQYKAMAFQQEAVANGLRSYDEASELRAQEAREKADDLTKKCREASSRVDALKRKARKAIEDAQQLEKALAKQGKSKTANTQAAAAHAKTT
mmetsp:Transcript_16836/g.32859  ORF Transcript_16836/g.32859 Transcript_16836/m.32859 type:complete len:564 (-) Transcript_16836:151-1842(-)|eukprot:CAMPEP_0171497778 /NCGR_PEP_ID=MMETSP0958-20121227/7465_1 /TAXON_ID=87120 /ORGANISM="Aurantiochytrium limacinum, Strain ATCCMYA-1381" /LENGTH=563 /DNA_ID=CAMNT_0012032067 /DNA_START=218 /DNA_END=1912 /DNA_ORIENTATION=+